MKVNHILALLAITGGLLAAFTNYSDRNHFYPTWNAKTDRVEGQKIHFVSASRVADLLYQREEGITILDVRDEQAYSKYHIPRARHFNEGDEIPVQAFSGTLVIYGSEGDDRPGIIADSLSGKTYVLKGGIDAWFAMVLFPDFNQYRVRNRESLEYLVSRSRYFGGSPGNIQLLNIDVRENRYREGC